MDNEKEERRKQMQRCLEILFAATNGPDELFKKALDDYIEGRISLSELEEKVDCLEYIRSDRESGAKEQYLISETEYELFEQNIE